jgi:hypothetical protein
MVRTSRRGVPSKMAPTRGQAGAEVREEQCRGRRHDPDVGRNRPTHIKFGSRGVTDTSISAYATSLPDGTKWQGVAHTRFSFDVVYGEHGLLRLERLWAGPHRSRVTSFGSSAAFVFRLPNSTHQDRTLFGDTVWEGRPDFRAYSRHLSQR